MSKLATPFAKYSMDILRTICRWDLTGEENKIFQTIVAETIGCFKDEAIISLKTFERLTEIKTKHSPDIIKKLIQRNMIIRIPHNNQFLYSINYDTKSWLKLSTGTRVLPRKGTPLPGSRNTPSEGSRNTPSEGSTLLQYIQIEKIREEERSPAFADAPAAAAFALQDEDGGTEPQPLCPELTPSNDHPWEQYGLTKLQADLIVLKTKSLTVLQTHSKTAILHGIAKSIQDPEQFKFCHGDFAKKLNVIIKCANKGDWEPDVTEEKPKFDGRCTHPDCKELGKVYNLYNKCLCEQHFMDKLHNKSGISLEEPRKQKNTRQGEDIEEGGRHTYRVDRRIETDPSNPFLNVFVHCVKNSGQSEVAQETIKKIREVLK